MIKSLNLIVKMLANCIYKMHKFNWLNLLTIFQDHLMVKLFENAECYHINKIFIYSYTAKFRQCICM